MANDGDAEAMENVLQYYDGYIKRLATKRISDEFGKVYQCVDDALYSRLRTKLILTVMRFKLE